MTGPVAMWHTEHVYFRRLLELLQHELDTFHRGERANYELMLDIVSYLTEYSDQFHHPREDVAFAKLAVRCPDLKLELARLTQEHRVVARAGETLKKQLEAILDGSIMPRAEVEVAAATYLVYYGNHIAKEDELVLDRAVEALTPEDWLAVRNAVPTKPDPLFGEAPEKRYRALRRRIHAEVS
ncbi:MAG TPA: hemerythrin domain-containing protein [Burkholderiales bacterium]|nr:hemerythrin domain-containing protein [Burkholderiales bacterium]